MARNVARAYIRLSRLREGDDSLSPTVQLDSARLLCASRGWELDEEASVRNQDLDVSGYSIGWKDRAGLSAHYRDAQDGLYTRLILPALDRLGRNTADTIGCWDAFESLGIQLYSIRENIDTETASGLLMRNIIASVAEMESRNTSARIKANVVKRAQLGRLHGGRLPFWLERNNANQIVLREPEATVIRRVVELRLSGKSYVAITRAINSEGFRTRLTGAPYERSFFVKFLQKLDWIETLLGTAFTRRGGRYETEPRTKRRISRGEPIRIANAFPPVIDTESGHRLLALLDHKVANSSELSGQKSRNRPSERWVLNGILRCAVCNSRMDVHSRRMDHKLRRTYVCSGHALQNGVSHSTSQVDAQLAELAILTVIGFELKQILQKPISSNPLPPKVRSSEDVSKEIARLLTLYARGTIPTEDLDALIDKLKNERTKIDEAEKRRVHRKPTAESLDFQSLIGMPDLRAIILSQQMEVSYPVFMQDVYDGDVKSESIWLPSRVGKNRVPRPCLRVKIPRITVDWNNAGDGFEPATTYYIPIFRMSYQGRMTLFYEFEFDLGDDLGQLGEELIPAEDVEQAKMVLSALIK